MILMQDHPVRLLRRLCHQGQDGPVVRPLFKVPQEVEDIHIHMVVLLGVGPGHPHLVRPPVRIPPQVSGKVRKDIRQACDVPHVHHGKGLLPPVTVLREVPPDDGPAQLFPIPGEVSGEFPEDGSVVPAVQGFILLGGDVEAGQTADLVRELQDLHEARIASQEFDGPGPVP